ncbi:MAG: hypothetical protein R3E01_08470 [Pirellulaceae bacterium]
MLRRTRGRRRKQTLNQRKLSFYRHRGSIEALEDRRLLAYTDLTSPELVEQEVRSVTINGTKWTILDGQDAPYFQIVVARDDAGLEFAALTLNNSQTSPTDRLLQITVEATIGKAVAQRHTITVDLAGDEFLGKFYDERLAELDDIESLPLESRDALDVESWPATVKTVAETLHAYAAQSSIVAANYAISPSIATADLRKLLSDVASLTAGVEKYDAVRNDTNEQATTKALGEVGFVLADTLEAATNSDDRELAGLADAIRQRVIANASSYYTLWSGFHVNHEIETVKRRGGNEEYRFALYEDGFYDLGHGLLANLGRPTSIEATLDLTPELPRVAAPLGEFFVNDGEAPTKDTYLRSIVLNPKGTDTLAHVAELLTNGETEIRHALFGFDLSAHDLKHVSGATLSLYADVAPTTGPPVYHSIQAILNDWDESAVWGIPVLSLGPQLDSWQPIDNATSVVNVTEAVQRVFRFGDMNINGQLDPQTSSGDIETFHTAVVDFSRYEAMFEQLASYDGELIHRGDGNWDGVIDAADIGPFFLRHGRVLGDYNLDGSVAAGDYTTWKDNFGLENAGYTDGDGNFNGKVDAADYTIWKDNFGLTAVATVPSVSFLVSETAPLGIDSVVKYATKENAVWPHPTLTVTQLPDTVLKRFSTNGTDLNISYNLVHENVTGLSVQVYRRSGGTDTLMMTHAISNSSQWTTGHHEESFTADFATTDVDADYQLVARLVPTYAGSDPEQDLVNNEATFAGGIFRETDLTWQIHGNDNADGVVVTPIYIAYDGDRS